LGGFCFFFLSFCLPKDVVIEDWKGQGDWSLHFATVMFNLKTQSSDEREDK
jgi:hypothetical protein